MPASFFLYIVLVALMVASLAYTPVFDAGLEKVGRFLTVTGLVIVAPFFILTTPQALKRFFAGFAVIAFLICGYSLTQLGGSERLVTPSSNTIGLGHVACSLILLIWFIGMPRLSFFKRVLVYPLLAVPLMALIGSGSRGAAIALGTAILMSLFLYRQFVADLLALTVLGFAAIPFLNIPEASFEYLGTLANSRSVDNLLNFRAELLGYGWQPVSYTHLDVYKRQAIYTAPWAWSSLKESVICCHRGSEWRMNIHALSLTLQALLSRTNQPRQSKVGSCT